MRGYRGVLLGINPTIKMLKDCKNYKSRKLQSRY